MEVRVSLASREDVLRKLGAPAVSHLSLPHRGCRSCSGLQGPPHLRPLLPRLEGLEPRGLQGSQAPCVEWPPFPVKHPHRSTVHRSRSDHRREEQARVGSPSSAEDSEPKGCGAGQGEGMGRKKGSCALMLRTSPPLWWTGGDIQEKAAANTGRDTATPHCPKQSTPNAPLGDETPL